MALATPNITPAQIVAVVGAVIGVAVAFGAPITKAQTDAVIQLVALLAGALILGDAHIRFGRSRALAPAPVALPVPDGTPGAAKPIAPVDAP